MKGMRIRCFCVCLCHVPVFIERVQWKKSKKNFVIELKNQIKIKLLPINFSLWQGNVSVKNVNEKKNLFVR